MKFSIVVFLGFAFLQSGQLRAADNGLFFGNPANSDEGEALAKQYMLQSDGSFYTGALAAGMQFSMDSGYTDKTLNTTFGLVDPRTETYYEFMVVLEENSNHQPQVVPKDGGGSFSSTRWTQVGSVGDAHCFFHPTDAECIGPVGGWGGG
jgi:hypothetical protein